MFAVILAEGIAPTISRWAESEERRILREGVSLDEVDESFAASLGIAFAEEIRVMVVDAIPLPVPAWCMRLARRGGLPVFAPGGMALGRGIYLLPGQEVSLRHELVHVAQYRRLGGIGPFMRTYLLQCLTEGYADAGLEREARLRSDG